MATSIFLSLELIHLIKWLLKHEKGKLKSLIQQAIDNGLASELDHLDNLLVSEELADDEILPHAFLDLLVFLENTLLEGLEKNDEHREIQENLYNTMSQLNIKDIEHDTLWSSIKQVKKEITKKGNSSPKDAPSNTEVRRRLLQKYLQNWKPHKQDKVN